MSQIHDSEVLLSVIIPSYDPRRLQDISDLLCSLKDQIYQNLELILVTESSVLRDSISQYVRKIGMHNLRIVYASKSRGVNESRNIGITNSGGQIVAVLDDDVVVPNDWAMQMIAAYKDFDNVVAVTGPVNPRWAGTPKDWLPRELYWLLSCTVWNWQNPVEIRNVGGMNCSYKRSALFVAGLYDTSIGPIKGGVKSGKWAYVGAEEIDLCIRMKKATLGKVIYSPGVVAYHKVYDKQCTMEAFTKRAFHFGYTKAFVKSKYGNGSDVLSLEKDHLKALLISGLFSHPSLNSGFKNYLKRFIVYGISLSSLAFGYCSFFLYKPWRNRQD